jgi:hypothetical protein
MQPCENCTTSVSSDNFHIICAVTRQVGEKIDHRTRLWTAPELLRMNQRPVNGTQPGDVYSFAIIVQEIVYRAQPYFCDDTGAEKGSLDDITLRRKGNRSYHTAAELVTH